MDSHIFGPINPDLPADIAPIAAKVDAEQYLTKAEAQALLARLRAVEQALAERPEREADIVEFYYRTHVVALDHKEINGKGYILSRCPVCRCENWSQDVAVA